MGIELWCINIDGVTHPEEVKKYLVMPSLQHRCIDTAREYGTQRVFWAKMTSSLILHQSSFIKSLNTNFEVEHFQFSLNNFCKFTNTKIQYLLARLQRLIGLIGQLVSMMQSRELI